MPIKITFSQHWLARLYVLAVAKALALVVFAFGFFLTRTQLLQTSTCEDFSAADLTGSIKKMAPDDSSTGCWLEPGVDKLVLLVLDGARYDFTTAPPYGKESDSLFSTAPLHTNSLSGRAPLHTIVQILEDDS